MIVNRTFWSRQKGSIQQAFSYAKDTTAINFSKKYGGAILPQIDIDDSLSFVQGEVYSYLENSDPKPIQKNSSNDFVVYGKENGEWSRLAGFETISEANTEAKNLIPEYEAIVVVKS